jgi:segregation and condensation protein B
MNPENDWMPGDLPGDLPEEPSAVSRQPSANETLPEAVPLSPGVDSLPPANDQLPATSSQPPATSHQPLEIPQLSLEALVEALLFVADGAVTVASLAEALEVTSRAVENALTVLAVSYAGRGLSLQHHRDKVQLTTHPAAAERVERFLGLAATTALSKAALETLAIIAYQQPVTRPQIEAVRGVNSDSVIKNLLSKGLIEEAGRTEGPGRPTLYTTTPEFLQHFGLTTLTDLPPLSQDGQPTLTSAELLKG